MGIDNYQKSVVRIFSKEGDVIGAGCLAQSNIIVTCAHVVKSALGGDSSWSAQLFLEKKITLDFPFRVKSSLDKYQATVKSYFPAQKDGAGDIAILRLDSNLLDIENLFIRLSDDVGSLCKFFGFTSAHPNGIWVDDLVFTGRHPAGTMQLKTNQFPEILVQPGCSGAPVWSERTQGIIGIMKSRDTLNRSAFVIPTETLLLYEKDLEQSVYLLDKQGDKWKKILRSVALVSAGVGIGTLLEELYNHHDDLDHNMFEYDYSHHDIDENDDDDDL